MPATTETGRALDTAIAANRIATPASATTKRAVPRASIAELNAMDLEDIHNRLAKMPVDDRSSFGKFLDLLDAPRNLIDGTVARVVMPGLYKRKMDAGDVGTGGMPNIHGSDILEELGVENRIAKAIGGFAIDVATDPLTFIGPGAAGAAVRLAKGGTQIITKSGAKAVRQAAKEAVTTGIITNSDVRALLEPLGWHGKRLEDLRASVVGGKSTPQAASNAILDDVFGKVKTGRVGRAASRVGLWDTEYGGGALSKFLYATDRELADDASKATAKAVRDFVGKYGKGTERGLAFGKNATSQIAHIPFTDIGIRVPAISSNARVAARNLRVARDTEMGLPAVDAIANRVRGVEDAAVPGTLNIGLTGRLEAARIAGDEIENVLGENAALRAFGGNDPVGSQAKIDANTAKARELAANAAKARDEVAAIVAEMTDATDVADDPATLMSLAYAHDAAKAEARLAHAKAEELASGLSTYTEWKNAANPDHFLAQLPPNHRAVVQRFIDDPDALEAALDTARAHADAAQNMATVYGAPLHAVAGSRDWNAVDIAKYALGTSDDIMGISVLGSMGESLRRVGLQDDNSLVRTLRRADAAVQRVFNVRSGTANKDLYAIRQANKGSPALQNRIATEIGENITKALDETGVGVNAANYQSAAVLATHLLQKKADGDAGHVFWNRPEFPDMTYAQVAAAHDAGKDVGSDLFKAIREAEQSGVLKNQAFRERLEAVAAKAHNDILEIGDAEVRDGILGELLGGYVPHVKTAESASAAGRVAENFGVQKASKGAEPFQRARTFDQYRFRDPETGVMHRFFEADRNLDKDAIDRLAVPQRVKDALHEASASAKRYDELVAAGHNLPGPRRTDILEMNRLARDNRFAPLLGGYNGDLFNASLPVVMAARAASHERAVGDANLGLLIDKYGIKADVQDLKNVMVNPDATVAVPGIGTVMSSPSRSQMGGPVAGVKVGDTLYRQLDGTLRGNGAIKSLLGRDLNGVLLPDHVAGRLEAVSDGWAKNQSRILDVAEAFTGLWRTQVLTHPSWMVNDLVGNLILMAGGDGQGATVNFFTLGKNLRDSLSVAMSKFHPERLRNLKVNVRGEELPGEEALKHFTDSAAFDNNFTTVSGMQAARAGALQLPFATVPGEKWWRAQGRAARPTRIMADAKAEASARAAMAGRAAPDIADKVGGFGAAGDRALRGVVAPWFRLNGLLNDTLRGAVYLNLVEQGYSHEEAGRAMLRMLYDYHDLSRVEEKIRTFVPFFSWIRSNTPHQVRLLATNPKFAASFPKLKHAIETAVADDSRVPETARPRWIRDAMAVQFTSDPATRQAFLAMSSLPIRDLFEYGQAMFGWEGVQGLMHYLSSSLNPAINTAYGLASGRELFSGRTIGVGQDIEPGRFIAGQMFRPFAEIGTGGADKGPLARAFDQGTGAGITRAVLGGKVQDISDERLRRQLLNQSRNAENQLRRRIAKSEAYQDAGSSFNARLELMALYRRMIAQGLGDEVPRWARDQLSPAPQAEAAVVD